MATGYEVQALLGSSWSGTYDDVVLALDAAKSFVASQSLTGLNVAQLDDVTRYVAAHIATAQTNPAGLKSHSLGDESRTWSDNHSAVLGSLSSTQFGRVAIMLDTTGTLGEAGKPKPRFAVL